MKVLLLYPEFPGGFWSFKYALKFIGCKATMPPLGLLTVAAMLPEEWNLRLVDINVKRLTEGDLKWADFVLISAMVVQRQSAKGLIARCKAAGVPVIAGGPLFTEESDQFPEVDYLVIGEAEETFPRFIADFKVGRAKRIYKADGYSDIRAAPVPRWDLIDLRNYASMPIQLSRGCPHLCDFCDITKLFGRIPRLKTLDQITAELDALFKAGWRKGVFFVDDNFIGNKFYIKKTILPALIAWQDSHGRPFSFYTEASIDLADDEELIGKMRNANFDRVFIGIETPEEGSLNECNKRQNVHRDLIGDIRKIQNAGIEVQMGLIVGFDHDTHSIFERMLDFVQKSGVPTAMLGMLQALPGTKLYKRLRTEGRVEGRATGDNVDGKTNIIPKMPLEDLFSGYKWLVRALYAPKNYYNRLRIFLKEYNPASLKKVSLSLQSFMTLMRSFFFLGVLGKERLCFWQLILWTIFRRPRLFAVAITQAIYGYHFRIVSERNIN